MHRGSCRPSTGRGRGLARHVSCCLSHLGDKHTEVWVMRAVDSVSARHVPPWSLNLCRVMPLPLWTMSRAPEASNSMLRGFVNPPSTSCTCHPLFTSGKLYEGTSTFPQLWATAVEADSPATSAVATRLVFIARRKPALPTIGKCLLLRWPGHWEVGSEAAESNGGTRDEKTQYAQRHSTAPRERVGGSKELLD